MPSSLLKPWLPIFGLALLCPGGAALAQSEGTSSGLVAGTLLLRGRVLGVLPRQGVSTITRIGGHLDTSDSVTPEIDLSYFFTNHIALEGEIGFLHTTLTAEGTQLGTATIGKVSSLPVLLVPQYHFLPLDRFNPYMGAGLAVVPYFNADPAGG
ncbi:MAG TPA: OmpW family outer membrane protein, partial [Acidisoma sp.]|nr:OmpW family outer membrane protein [Acidisoma sp.]